MLASLTFPHSPFARSEHERILFTGVFDSILVLIRAFVYLASERFSWLFCLSLQLGVLLQVSTSQIESNTFPFTYWLRHCCQKNEMKANRSTHNARSTWPILYVFATTLYRLLIIAAKSKTKEEILDSCTNTVKTLCLDNRHWMFVRALGSMPDVMKRCDRICANP